LLQEHQQRQQQQQQQYAAYQQHYAAQQGAYAQHPQYAAYYQQQQQQHQAYYAAYYQQAAAASAAQGPQQHQQQQHQQQQSAGGSRYEYVATADPHADSLLWAGALLDKASGDVTVVYEVMTLAEAGQGEEQGQGQGQESTGWALMEKLHLEACHPHAHGLAPPAHKASRYLRLRHVPKALAAVGRKGDVLLAANGRPLVGPQAAVAEALGAAYGEGGLRRLRWVLAPLSLVE
jgi:hypothetical protein